MYENPFRHEAARRREQLERAARDCFEPPRRRLPRILPHPRAWIARAKQLLPVRIHFGKCCDANDCVQPST
jgi:hypothetical protein